MTATAPQAVSLDVALQQAVAHHQAGRLQEAEQIYRAILDVQPNQASANHNLGVLAGQVGQHAAGLPYLQAALAADPLRGEYSLSYAGALLMTGQAGEALAILQAVRQRGFDSPVLQALWQQAVAAMQGVPAPAEIDELIALFAARRFAELESRARLLLEQYPDFGFAWKALGLALQMQGKDALAALQKATALLPDDADAHIYLGVALQALGQYDDAAQSYLRALEIKPDFAEAHCNLGSTLKDLGQFDYAVESYRRALEIKPDFADAYKNLGNALQILGKFDDAVESYRRALEIKPDWVEAHNDLLFTLNYHPNKSSEAIFAVYREYDERFGLPQREKWRTHGNSREIHRRLKVGYVSPDFRRHACRHFLEPLLAHHDKNAVEVYAYAELAREDEVTARYKGYVDHWAPTLGMTDDALSDRIRADGIDILVDLAGHTAKNRLAVFARKPAPVSLSWLGFGYTTGLTAMDYLLSDAACAPEGSEGLFSETPWRLETPGYVYRPAAGMGAVNPLPALTRGYVTFGALTRAVRINPRTIRVWSEVLKRVAGARLVINSRDYRDATMRDALTSMFAAHGISRERLEIGFHTPPWDVLRGLDIGLDCFPHNSGTTLFETLYMGIPFVTLAERPSVGRLGSSILEGVGYSEWIAHTEEEYVDLAVALASNFPKLANLRAGLRQKMEIGPLMNEVEFARKVETAYREMFGKWAREDESNQEAGAESVTIDQALRQAVAHHQVGRL
ncbi:MAG: tetratricopeptide repeat protein [Sulfuricellaceae bacterium]